MNKSEYRKLFNSIVEERSITIDPILKANNISTGNFYRFLKYDDERGDRALSEEKCALLYKAITDSGVLPTNRAWMESLDNKEMAKFIKNNFARKDPDIKQRDIEKWLIKTREPGNS